MSTGDRFIWITAWAFVVLLFLGVLILAVMLTTAPPGPGGGGTVVIIGGYPYRL